MENKNLIEILADVTHNNQQILRIMKGIDKIWPSNNNYIVEIDAEGVVCSIASSSIAAHSSLSGTIVPEINYAITSLSITMGGSDITSEVYDDTDGSITISDVTGDVIVSVVTKEIIVFADANVKAICVQNWGGSVVEGEITPAEAAAVTTLNELFRANTTITSFNELEYFTGLTTLANAFRDCSNLTSAKVPKAPLTSMYYAFYGCSKITSIDIPTDQNWIFQQSGAERTFYNCVLLEGELDLSSIKRQSGYNFTMTLTFGYCRKVTKIILPKADGSLDSCFMGCSNLETIVTDLFTIYYAGGSYRFRNIIGANNANTVCGKLKNITYGFRGQGVTFALDLACAPLTHESALQVIDGLRTVSSTVYLTFSALTRATLTDDEIAVATGKGWSVATRG